MIFYYSRRVMHNSFQDKYGLGRPRLGIPQSLLFDRHRCHRLPLKGVLVPCDNMFSARCIFHKESRDQHSTQTPCSILRGTPHVREYRRFGALQYPEKDNEPKERFYTHQVTVVFPVVLVNTEDTLNVHHSRHSRTDIFVEPIQRYRHAQERLSLRL